MTKRGRTNGETEKRVGGKGQMETVMTGLERPVSGGLEKKKRIYEYKVYIGYRGFLKAFRLVFLFHPYLLEDLFLSFYFPMTFGLLWPSSEDS